MPKGTENPHSSLIALKNRETIISAKNQKPVGIKSINNPTFSNTV